MFCLKIYPSTLFFILSIYFIPKYHLFSKFLLTLGNGCDITAKPLHKLKYHLK